MLTFRRVGIFIAVAGVIVVLGLLWVKGEVERREQECEDSFTTWVTAPPPGTVPVILTEDWCRELLTDQVEAGDD